MSASDERRVVLALAIASVTVSNAAAHQREDYLQAARIDVAPDRVSITLDLTPGIAVAESFIAALDHDRDGSLSADERREYAVLVAGALDVRLDDRPLQAGLVASSFPEPAAVRRGEGTVRLELVAALSSVSPGAHRLFFGNAHLSGHSAYLANALVPGSPRVNVTGQRRDADQRLVTIEYTLAADPRGRRP